MRRKTLLAAILLSVGFGTALAYGPWLVWRSYAVRSWPTVEGVVLRSEVVEARKGGGRAWRPEVEVRYEVDGRTLSTDEIWVAGPRTFRDKGRALEIAARYPVNATAAVSFHPDDPRDAVLEPSEVWRAWLTIGFGLVLLVAGAIVVARRG